MYRSPANKPSAHTALSPPGTIRKKSLPPYDRHIQRIDRTRYELSPSTSNDSTCSYRSSLEQTILKKKTLTEFALELSAGRSNAAEKRKVVGRSSAALRSYRVSGWKDNYYTNLLDWSHNNFVCVALHNDLCFYNMAAGDEFDSSLYRKYRFQRVEETINSIKFSQRNNRIGLGYNSGKITCYDFFKEKVANAQKNHHAERITAVQWEGNVILSGGKDCQVKSFDVKSGKDCFGFTSTHKQEICSLKSNGSLLASGGNDNTVCIYDFRKPEKPLTFYQHAAAIKALEWMEPSTLLSGGGTTDRMIKFWKDGAGVFNEIDTGSQVCGIKASITTDEIVSCQGFSLNQIIIWNREGERELTIHGHSERVLYCALSPSGEYLATGAGDQLLKIWRLFPRREQSRWESSELR